MPPALPTKENDSVFESEARTAAQRVRSALSDALVAIGADATKPQSLARQLGLDKNLAWKAARIVTEEDPLAAIPRLPGRPGVKILLQALDKRGVGLGLVSRLRATLDDLDQLVVTHAGDRETLEKMLSGVTKEGQQERDEGFRKQAFQGSSAIWGVQARVQISSHYVAPSSDPALLDAAVVSGLIDFKRLRADMPWAVAAMRSHTDDGSPNTLGDVGRIDDSISDPNSPPILADFSSDPMPEMVSRPGRSGVTRYQIAEGQVGNIGAVSCVTGWYRRNGLTRNPTADDKFGEHTARLNTPCELLIHDIFIHRSLAFALNPTLHVYGQLPGGAVYPDDGRDIPEVHTVEQLTRLNNGGPPDVTIPEYGKYRPLVELVMTRMGWQLNDFVGFRYRLRYPPVPAVAVCRYPLESR